MVEITKSSSAVDSVRGSSIFHDMHHQSQPIAWLEQFVNDIDARSSNVPIHPVIKSLQDLIESRTELRMWASVMFQEVPNKNPYNNQHNKRTKIKGAFTHTPVRGYRHMIDLLAVIVAEVGPPYALTVPAFGVMGLPFQAVVDWPMGTPSGHAFFLDTQVNAKLKDILDAWRDNVLTTSKSLAVVTTAPGCWLSPESVAAFERDANLDSKQSFSFEQLFACDPYADPVHWGFKSWDDFFVRRFRDIDALRPVSHADESTWIANACEALPVAIKLKVKRYDEFWLKGTNYSIADLLGHHELADNFVGGTIYQGVLRTTSYHRWHAPVSGHVVFAQVINGAYFSERSTNGLGSEPIGPPTYDQVYLGHVATRALVFIQADEPIGLMCFIAIGIADVSSCEIAARFSGNWPQPITKGEEMGMFHYGGSSHCLVFRKDLHLVFMQEAIPGSGSLCVPVRGSLAFAAASS
ncbi:hypothetical protein VHEMI01733 [[Torrubiella] hemipterigena]|uniref:L-tryptophan decarboxylase PsiD-like domain-containing protein n=1 Tax=[Torrubiella] hemipterigena TaxID=1531966 RepID=A0A0A1SMP8_9HYPO|nr:hypothetical protein VHEMI01733 [[Torrubiella] hemipterigena]